MESLEEEALFRSYPYLVQSPTTSLSFHSPTTQRHLTLLSHYSSSRGSTNSLILHDNTKKIDNVPNYESPQYEGEMVAVKMDEKRFDEEEDEEVDEKGFGKKKMWNLVTFSECDSCIWIWFQISLRVMVSFGVALLFFYLITKPPPPVISLQIEKTKAFELGEGVDNTGVTTKFLTCNSSLNLAVNIKSKLYGLHIHPVVLTLSFNNVSFATSTEPHELYASSNGPTSFLLYVGTSNKPMYGAGRSMQDILDSGKGLSLNIHVQIRSRFRIVGKLIRLKYHHRAECILVLNRTYDKHNKTLMHDNQCTLL